METRLQLRHMQVTERGGVQSHPIEMIYRVTHVQLHGKRE